MAATENILKKAMTSFQAESLNDAERYFKRLLHHQPMHIGALNILSIVLTRLKKYGEAEHYIKLALKHNSNSYATFYNYGIILKALKRPSEALERFNQALAINPSNADIWNNRGTVLTDLKRYDDAVSDFNKAIGLQPNYLLAFYNKGKSLATLQRHDEAFAAFDKALLLKPDLVEAWLGRGKAFQDLQRYEEAFAAYDKAIAIKPDCAEAYCNRGIAFQELGQFDAAITNYDKAIAIKSDYAEAYAQKSLVLLLQADFDRGWHLYERRWETSGLQFSKRNFVKPLWLGKESLADKTILLYSEQGLGDTIQFCRYAKLVADLGARVILEVPKPLINLLGNLSGVTKLAEVGSPLPPFDYQCPLMSLPLAFKTTLSNIPANIPYLKADEKKSLFWREKLGEKNKPRVGLVWSGGFIPNLPEVWAVKKRRNIPLAKIAGLKNPDIEFYSLQKGQPAKSELANLIRDNWGGPKIFDFTNLLNDFSDTAALIENLDLVISVDTSTAHLAGALGKPVSILNRFDTCWRWLLERTDSPWYPTAKLYRQEKAGNWDGVVQRVKADLIGFRSGGEPVPIGN